MTIPEKKEKIKEMRKRGYSYKEIRKILRVSNRDITEIAKNIKFSQQGRKRYYKKVKGIIKPIKKQKRNTTLAKTRLIGNLLFDGSVYKTVEYHYGIMYVNSSFELVKRFCDDMIVVYGVSPTIFKIDGKVRPYYRAKYSSKLIYLDLLNYTKSYSTSNRHAKIPECILNGTNKIKLEFLRTFWDNEGSISKIGVLRGVSVSIKVIKQLAQLHDEFGFEAKIYKDQRKGNLSYILSLGKNIENRKKFCKYGLFTESIVTKGHFSGARKIEVVKQFIKPDS